MIANTVLAEIVDYFHTRGLVWPNAEDALLFLVSEVGEMAGAYAIAHEDELDANVKSALASFVLAGADADDIVRNRRGWVRNNNRAHDDEAKTAEELKRDLEHEIGDVRMMLELFSDDVAGEASETLMRKKMRHQMRKTKEGTK